MPVARSPEETFSYALEEDRKLPNPTRFHFKALPQGVEDAIWNELYAAHGRVNENVIGANYVKILSASLTGWDDFLDENGQVIHFQPSKMAANLERLWPKHKAELAYAVFIRNNITESESD